MRFMDFDTVHRTDGLHLLRHRRHGWWCLIVIEDGQVFDVGGPRTGQPERFGPATSEGVDYVAAVLTEPEARLAYARERVAAGYVRASGDVRTPEDEQALREWDEAMREAREEMRALESTR